MWSEGYWGMCMLGGWWSMDGEGGEGVLNVDVDVDVDADVDT